MRMLLLHLFVISNGFSVSSFSSLGLSRAIALRKASSLEVGDRKAVLNSEKVQEYYILDQSPPSQSGYIIKAENVKTGMNSGMNSITLQPHVPCQFLYLICMSSFIWDMDTKGDIPCT